MNKNLSRNDCTKFFEVLYSFILDRNFFVKSCLPYSGKSFDPDHRLFLLKYFTMIFYSADVVHLDQGRNNEFFTLTHRNFVLDTESAEVHIVNVNIASCIG